MPACAVVSHCDGEDRHGANEPPARPVDNQEHVEENRMSKGARKRRDRKKNNANHGKRPHG